MPETNQLTRIKNLKKFSQLSENSKEKYTVLVIFYAPLMPFGFTVKMYHFLKSLKFCSIPTAIFSTFLEKKSKESLP